MKTKTKKLIDKLSQEHSLTKSEYKHLVKNYSAESLGYIAPLALEAKKSIYGDGIYIRGLIEISNICKNDCIYCGIRASNTNCNRYRLSKDEILSCCKNGYELGFRTFVLQGGEDMHYTDEVLCDIVKSIKDNYPDCAVTLSVGERSFESYKRLKDAGADRYLLRHETADKRHYKKLHPRKMSFDNRMSCLNDLKRLGFQVGCGFMVGSPYQKASHIAKDLKFIETFSPHMCGIGPFIPHKDTPFKDYPAGDVGFCIYLLAIIRLIKPNILLPATTALATLSDDGRVRAIMCGANVIMPNLSPDDAKKNYNLYNGKKATGLEAAEHLENLKEQLESVNANIVCSRGDTKG